MSAVQNRRRRAITTMTAAVMGFACSAGAAATAGELPSSPAESQPDVAQIPSFEVEYPSEGTTLDGPRPTFEGTAIPGSNMSLELDGEEYAKTRSNDDGAWTMTPERDLPVGVPFSMTVTQRAFTDSETHMVVKDLTVRYPRIAVETPSDGATAAGDLVIEGSSFANAMIGLRVEGEALDEPLVAGMGPAAPDEQEEWSGRFDISADGAWTFTPQSDLPAGEYELTAEVSQVGADPELAESSATSSFVVSEDGELPDTGSSATWSLSLGAALLVFGGAAVLILRGRHA